MDMVDYGLLTAFLGTLVAVMTFGFLIGVCFGRNMRPKEKESERDSLDVQELFVTPSGQSLHRKGCAHLGSTAKSAKKVQPCKHCFPGWKPKTT
jgi:hypothetical protein